VRVVEAAQLDVAALRAAGRRHPGGDPVRRMRRNAVVHTVAAAVFAVVAAASWQASGDDPGGPVTTLTVALLLGWPVVPTLLTVTAPRADVDPGSPNLRSAGEWTVLWLPDRADPGPAMLRWLLTRSHGVGSASPT
jgi:hypothetical protein